jgi:ribosomal protein L11 methyltransferase
MTASRPPAGWFELILALPAGAAEAAAAWLIERGSTGLELRDASHPQPPAELPADWVELRASFAAAGPAPAEQLRAELAAFQHRWSGLLPGLAAARIRLEQLDEQDWAHNWRTHFAPVRVGRFYVHPGWEPAAADAPWPLQIDPGLAFGTGMHPTTRLCLQALEARLGSGPLDSVLDVGCGSGILALAAARAGVERVVAVDDDPIACRVTADNARRNGLSGRLAVALGGPERAAGAFELVLANILSGALMAMAAALLERLAAGGELVLSGVLAEEQPQLAAHFAAAGCRPLAVEREGDWCALHLAGPARPDAAEPGR